MSEHNNFAVVPRAPCSLEKTKPGAKRILPSMVADTLALAQAKSQERGLSALQPYSSADLESWFQKGEDYYYGRNVLQDYCQAVHWYRKAAEQGQAMAQCCLGWCYHSVHGVPRDYGQAVHWYRKAAEQGQAMAQRSLGWCYNNGHGVPQDYAQAVHWYREAAEQGEAIA